MLYLLIKILSQVGRYLNTVYVLVQTVHRSGSVPCQSPSLTKKSIFGEAKICKKKALVLEEQAVGDVMQFITLMPDLLSEASHVSILMSDRLIPIYNRSFKTSIAKGLLSILSFSDIANNKVDPEIFIIKLLLDQSVLIAF